MIPGTSLVFVLSPWAGKREEVSELVDGMKGK